MKLAWEPDELDNLTLGVRALLLSELKLDDDAFPATDLDIRNRETISALLGMVHASMNLKILWPDHLVEQFRDLREEFVLEQEFEEFMECQDEIRAKKSATASEPVS
ncbi:hypothetical protein QP868_02230 [Brevibacterium sp. UMB1308A]|nr:hypothetical protein [Brevibacterium sp. UMB1308B]MDK8712716.1 hypothetical protein [Brevibacterium sp. UMB1308A]